MAKKKLRIGIFTHNYPVTSKERKDAGIFVYDFSHELAKHAEVKVFCPDFGGKKENYKKVPVKWMNWGGPTIKFGNWPFYSPISVFNFFKLITIGNLQAEKFVRENKIDYVLACWTMPSSVYALWVNLRLKMPYFVWILGSDVNIYARFPIVRHLTILALRRATNRFSNSYFLINATEKLSHKKCDYMAAITNFQAFKVKPRNLSNNVFNFLFVSRLERVKGPDILINACYELKKKNSKFLLHILGDGTMKESLEQLIAKLDIKDNVKFYGNCGKEEISSFMKSSQALVIASRAESIPLVMVEAARFGLPSVTTDVGDCKRAIIKYKIGFYAKRENPESLANAMNKSMKEGKNFKRRRQMGLREISNEFKQENSVKTFLSNI